MRSSDVHLGRQRSPTCTSAEPSGFQSRGLQAGLSQRMSVRDRNVSNQEEPGVPASITAPHRRGHNTHTHTHTHARARVRKHVLLFEGFNL